MSDHETARSTEGGVTLDEVAGAMAAMRAENAALAARLEELERRSGPPAVTWDASAGLLETETPAVEGEAGEGEEDPAGASRGESGISRRSAFKALGAAAAAGAGVALGATVFGADPAAAEPVEYVRLGHSNVAVAETSITTDMGHGMLGSTSDATSAGIGGQDTSTGGGTGVQAQSTNGLGLVAQGGQSPLLLTPSTSAGPPTSGAHSRGEVYVDAAGFAFVCSLAGSPGTWQRITPAAPDYNNSDAGSLGMSGSLNLLATSVRLFDSRNGSGPIGPNSGIVVQVGGTTFGSVTIPSGVVGVLGNVTAVNPSGTGYLTLYASTQTPGPFVSNLNFQKGDIARGNFCAVGLNGGQMIIYATGASTEVVFDATGFIYGSPQAAV